MATPAGDCYNVGGRRYLFPLHSAIYDIFRGICVCVIAVFPHPFLSDFVDKKTSQMFFLPHQLFDST